MKYIKHINRSKLWLINKILRINHDRNDVNSRMCSRQTVNVISMNPQHVLGRSSTYSRRHVNTLSAKSGHKEQCRRKNSVSAPLLHKIITKKVGNIFLFRENILPLLKN
jgi:hypothetical protein